MPAGFFNNGSLTNTLVAANNVDFSGAPNPSPSVTTNGQLLIGSTASPNIKVGTLTSPGGTITIGYSSPNITLDLSGGGVGIDSIGVQTGTSPIVPTAAGLVTINGATVAAGTNPVRTDGTGANTMAVEVQISQAIAATDATKIGLANFDSAAFDVDVNGFVQLNGGGIAATAFDVDAHTAPGTDPVVPNASGVVIITGSSTVAGTTPVQTNSLAANTYAIQVQKSQAIAATDATKVGLCNFNSAQFSVDSNGFVSTAGSAAFPWSDTSGTVTATAFNGYFITATCTSTLPASPSEGDTISYCVDTTDILTITANTGQKIRLGTSLSISGGTCASTSRGDSITLVYRTTGATWFAVPGPQGNWNVQTS